MSSQAAIARQLSAARKRADREARKRRTELQRQLKDLAKLNLLQQARLAVETHQNELEILNSVHLESSPEFDWKTLAYALPPHPPFRSARNELQVFLKMSAALTPTGPDWNPELEAARIQDESDFQARWSQYHADHTEWSEMKSLAMRVLAGESRAYVEAINEFSAFAEIAHLGSSIDFTVHTPALVECVIQVNGREIIPTEVKSFSATGKVLVKAMPKAQFHEIYQDYVCGCVLRVAREVLALLPVNLILVTATVEGINSSNGMPADIPVLSVAIPRSVTDGLNFETLDPSDSLETFLRRGDVKTSRRSGEFTPIVPLTPSDLTTPDSRSTQIDPLIDRVRNLQTLIRSELKTSKVSAVPPISVL